MNMHSFIVYIKTDNIYKAIAEDAETRFDTSNYELDRPLPNGKNKKLIELIKVELGRKILAKFVGLREKTCTYLMTVVRIKRQKAFKKCVIKKNLNLKIVNTV